MGLTPLTGRPMAGDSLWFNSSLRKGMLKGNISSAILIGGLKKKKKKGSKYKELAGCWDGP